MALVLNGVKYLVLHQAEEGIFITGCCNKSWTETGTQLVLTAATTHWYPLTHAKSSAKNTRRAGVPCAKPSGRQDAPLRQGRRLRGVPAGHDRGAPAAPDPRPVLYCVLSNHWHFAVWPDADGQVNGLLPLAGTRACDALEGRAPDRRVRSSVSGTVQELPGAERRTSGAACGRGCMEKMRSRPSYRLGSWNAPWIGPGA